MKHLLTISLISVLIALGAISCRRAPEGAAHKWAKITPEFDSLTTFLEENLFDQSSLGQLGDAVGKMSSISSELNGRKAAEAKIQILYWCAYADLCLGLQETALQVTDQGQKLADSISDEYARHRFMEVNETFYDKKDGETLRTLLQQLDYYKKIGDWGQQGNMAMYISNNLLYPGTPELSLHYLEMADSLFELAGLESRRDGLRINKFTLMCQLKRFDEAQQEYDKILAQAKEYDDIHLQEIMLRNHYYFYNDSASLFDGYEMAKQIAQTTPAEIEIIGPRGLYEGLLCRYSLEHNDLDKGGYFATLCEKHLGELSDPDLVIMEYEALADYYNRIGKSDKALDYMKKYVELKNELNENQAAGEKVYQERLNTIHRYDMEVEAERREMKQRQYLILLISGAIIIALVVTVSRWRSRQRVKTLQMKLEAERNERKILAMSMHNEETEKLLDYVKTETERMSQKGNVDSKDLAQIKTNVKLHMAGKNEKETFEEAFANVSPEFAKRLKALAPGLTTANIRLCTYIYMGLTNQEIANLMHITDNGLRVARFRLKQKFGLAKDDSLEDFLRNVVEKK